MGSRFDSIAWVYDFAVSSRWFCNPDRLLSLLELTGEEAVADLGGGTGLYAAAFSPHCRSVTVIDESARMLSRVPGAENVSVMRADIRSLPIPDNSYDDALMIDVVHHVPSAEKAIAEAHRILKPGGRLLVVDFDAHSIKTRLIRPFEVLLFGHIHYRTPEAMAEVLCTAGFTDVRCEDCAWNYIVTGRST